MLGRSQNDGNCLLEQRLRLKIILAGHSPIMRQRAHHQIPGVHAIGCLALRVKIFRRVKLRFDRGNNRLSDLVLNREYVGNIAIVAFGPYVAAGFSVN